MKSSPLLKEFQVEMSVFGVGWGTLIRIKFWKVWVAPALSISGHPFLGLPPPHPWPPLGVLIYWMVECSELSCVLIYVFISFKVSFNFYQSCTPTFSFLWWCSKVRLTFRLLWENVLKSLKSRFPPDQLSKAYWRYGPDLEGSEEHQVMQPVGEPSTWIWGR